MTIFIRKIDDLTYGVSSPRYHQTLRDVAKATPGMRWAPDLKTWIGWNDACAVVASRLKQLGTPDIRIQAAIGPSAFSSSDGREKRVSASLRDYQITGVKFILENAGAGAMLADDMGLGKTLTTLRSIQALGKPAVIVCPSFVRGVWSREVKKWLGDKVHVIELFGTSAKCKVCKGAKVIEVEHHEVFCEACQATGLIDLRFNSPATIFLLHYDIIHAWVDPILQVIGEDFVVAFDEAHYLQSDTSRRSKACRGLARKATYRIGLTGTPMTSRPRDLWNVVDTLCPNRFGRPFDFYLRYCAAEKETVTTKDGDKTFWNTKGSSHLDELNFRMKYFMLRRTKSDVALELPPKTRQIVEVEVPRPKRDFRDILKSEKLLREALALAADGKLPKVLEMIESHVEGGSKIICFTYRKAIAEQIADALRGVEINVAVITGDVKQSARNDTVENQPSVICCTMDSTAVGIDLSYADVGVFVELDWVPSKLAQAEARLHRFGQKKNVLIQYVIAAGTADEIISDTVIEKLDHFVKAIGKIDDGLKETLEGGKLSSVDQLRRFYEKVMAEKKTKEKR